MISVIYSNKLDFIALYFYCMSILIDNTNWLICVNFFVSIEMYRKKAKFTHY